MTGNPQEYMLTAWKQHIDIAFRMIEAVTEGATRLHEVQLDAATEAHADAVATQKAIQGARDPARILELQAQWTRANAEKTAAYWRKVFETCLQTEIELAQCAFRHAPAAMHAAAQAGTQEAKPRDASTDAVLEMMDNAYKQWLAASQQFYRIPQAAQR
jgi:phasin family protein